MMRKIEPSSFRRMPWKNGGGETSEIAVVPEGASADDFDWRVSTARVAESGPFSLFQGIDRSLVVLSGLGLHLVIGPPGGDQEVLLDPASAPFAFAGDIPAYADLMAREPVVDFNVMTRRGKFEQMVRRVKLQDPTEVVGDYVVLYCLSGSTECFADGKLIVLTVGDALIANDTQSDGTITVKIERLGPEVCELLAAQFFRRGPRHE